MTEFMDDTQLFRMMKPQAKYEELQKNLSLLVEYVKKCQVKLSVSKCKVIHIGANLDVTGQERDLGFMVDT